MKTALIAALATIVPAIALADTGTEGGAGLSFSAGLGARVAPEYFGAEDYETGVTGGFEFDHLRIGRLEFGNPDPDAVTTGLTPRGSFRFIGARDSDDYSELDGLDDIDTSVELGGGLGYRTQNFFAFADARYGVIGHESWVGELGADAIFRPSRDLTVTIGPRALWGSEDYTSTYFGVTAEEAGRSAFSEYDADSGLVSAGIEIGATYRISRDWSLDGTARWERLTGDAADSPIVQSEDSMSLSLVLMRRFNFGR